MSANPRNARRAQTRALVFWGQSCVQCLLKDFSETGARIKFTPGFKIKKGEESYVLWKPLPQIEPMKLKIRCEWADSNKGLAGFTWLRPGSKELTVIKRLVDFHLR